MQGEWSDNSVERRIGLIALDEPVTELVRSVISHLLPKVRVRVLADDKAFSTRSHAAS
jgi:hypothetical protein